VTLPALAYDRPSEGGSSEVTGAASGAGDSERVAGVGPTAGGLTGAAGESDRGRAVEREA
jgi:hypothetical protein